MASSFFISASFSFDFPCKPRTFLTPDQVDEGKEALASFKEKTSEIIDKEFKQLEKYLKITQTELPERCTVALNEENVGKNRNPSTIPYDYNRVILQSSSEDDDPLKGYINASPISITSGGECVSKFIATQGPLPDTREDFWEMVIENRCPIIVMLTGLIEKDSSGKEVVKCADYFQADDGPLKFGNISVVQEWKVTTDNALVLRCLKVQRGEDIPFCVLHLHHTTWPDHGVPKDMRAIHEILNITYNLPPKHSPIVVHCSAGVGRTGTYIAIHNTIQRILAGEKSALNLYNTISVFRLERFKIVPEVNQYEFCYKGVIQELEELVCNQQP